MGRYTGKPFLHASSDQLGGAEQSHACPAIVNPNKSNDSTPEPPGSTTNPSDSSLNHPSPEEGPISTTQPKSDTHVRASYLPSVPSIPSVRKYLFARSNTSPTNSPCSSSRNLQMPAFGCHHPAFASDIHDSAQKNSSDPAAPSLLELRKLVDKTFGPVGELQDTLAKRLPHDRLVEVLNKSVTDRNRLLIQFLRARHHDATEAMKMIMNAIYWRKNIGIETYLRNTTNNMLQPTACFPMTVISSPDACRQPVIYGLIRLLDKKKAERVPFQNAMLSFLETSYFGESYVIDDMVIILDFRDWSIRRNAPYRLVRDGIQTLQDYYPERLARVFLVNYPATIRAAYTAISPIIEAGAKEKIVWIPDADPSCTLRKFISPKSIPSFLGGELNASFPPAWPDVAAEFQTAMA